MPSIGITSLSSLISAPTGCVINEISSEATREVKTIKDSSGITIQAAPVAMTEVKISAKGKGAAPLSTLAATSVIESGDIVITSVSVDESNEDFPDFSIEAIQYL